MDIKEAQGWVLVTWYDSSFQGGWVPPEKTLPLPVLKCIGYVTALTEDFVEISMCVADNSLKLNPLAIPIGCIIKVDKVAIIEN